MEHRDDELSQSRRRRQDSENSEGEMRQSLEAVLPKGKENETEGKVSFSILLQQCLKRKLGKRSLSGSYTKAKLQKHQYRCSGALNSSLPDNPLLPSSRDFLETQRRQKYSESATGRIKATYPSHQHHHLNFNIHHNQKHHKHHKHTKIKSHYHKHRKVLQRNRRSQHRLEKQYKSSQRQNIQQIPFLQFSQSEYRRTVTEDIPRHTSILTVSALSLIPS